MDQQDELLKRLMSCRLLVTDLDGTLADTEPYHCESYQVILQAILGRAVRVSIDEIIGKTGIEIWTELGRKHQAKLNAGPLNRLRKLVLLGLYAKKPPAKEDVAIEIIERFQGPRFVLTTQGEESAKALIAQLNLTHLFQGVISMQSEKVGEHTKLEVIEALATECRVPLSQVAWIEDGSTELDRARREGIVVIVVERTYNSNKHDQADFLIQSTL